ncbi:MAG TPA: mannose-6-phosphate isomerase, class I, partial [Microlunatus sp.]|nr:mannose-6-phosphate isomerase, class I [Microlunatus sp.]
SLLGGRSLADAIAADSAGVVGAAAVGEFGPQLPYLLKVLAAAQPLSLQAHPSRAGAEAGFAREEAAGLDRAAPTRLYRDDWPKPEMLVALGDVEALCGFREPDETYALFARLGVAAATDLVAPLQGGGPDQLAEVFARVLGLPEGEREVIAQVVTAAAELDEAGAGETDPELGLFVRTAVELDEHYPGDPGVLAALLMNRMGFGRFQGLFLPAGNLHAYLHGIGVEIMANSDNVMRGGLTPKHVDVSELLAILDFTPGMPELVDVVEESTGVWRYRTPAPEFALWRLEAATDPVTVPAAGSGRIVLVIEGRVEVSDQTTSLSLVQGQSVFGYPGDALTVTGVGGTGTVTVAAPGL